MYLFSFDNRSLHDGCKGLAANWHDFDRFEPYLFDGSGDFALFQIDAVLHHSGQADRFSTPPTPHAASIGKDNFVACLLFELAAPDTGGVGANDDVLADGEGIEAGSFGIAHIAEHGGEFLGLRDGQVVDIQGRLLG